MKLRHFFHNTCYTQPNTTSYWPSCTQQPNTLSFRSVLRESSSSTDPPKSSSALIEDLLKEDNGETIERVIRDLKSDYDHRLFFELEKTNNNSVINKNEDINTLYNLHLEKKCVNLLSMESRNPYLDFKKSMEEMVEAYNGVMDWDWLYELLGCYLKANGSSHHEFIIGAFLDMLLNLDLKTLGLSFSSLVASSSSTFSSSEISSRCCSSSNSPADETPAGH